MNKQKIYDGGPAFPEPMTYHPGRERASFCQEEGGAPGMSLRDWFAGQALAGALSNPALGDTRNAVWFASYALECADAMLATRAKRKEES